MASTLGTIAQGVVDELVAQHDAFPHAFTAQKRWKPRLAPGQAVGSISVDVAPAESESEFQSRDASERLYRVAVFVKQELVGSDAEKETISESVDELAEALALHLEEFVLPSFPENTVQIDAVDRVVVVYEEKQRDDDLFFSRITLTYRELS